MPFYQPVDSKYSEIVWPSGLSAQVSTQLSGNRPRHFRIVTVDLCRALGSRQGITGPIGLQGDISNALTMAALSMATLRRVATVLNFRDGDEFATGDHRAARGRGSVLGLSVRVLALSAEPQVRGHGRFKIIR
jgi:hypothetical protein